MINKTQDQPASSTSKTIFSEQDFAIFKAASLSIPKGCPTIDVMKALIPHSQMITPITAETLKAFRMGIINGKDIRKRDDVTPSSCKKEEGKAIVSPFSTTKAGSKPLITGSPQPIPNENNIANVKPVSLLIPSQKCLKRKYRRVSSFLDQNETNMASAALLAGLAAIENAKTIEKARREEKEALKKQEMENKKLNDKKMYKSKPKAKEESQSKEPPKTPPRRITLTVPMAPYREKDPEDDSVMEGTWFD